MVEAHLTIFSLIKPLEMSLMWPKLGLYAKFFPQEVETPTYHFRIIKIVGISYSMVVLWYTVSEGMVEDILTIVVLGQTFPTVSWATQIEIICKIYASWKLTCQLTTLGFTKLLEFYILWSCLQYTLKKEWCRNFFSILLLI